MATIAERNILFRLMTDTKKAQKDISAIKKDVTGLDGLVRGAASNFAGLFAFDVAGRAVSGLQALTNQTVNLALASEQTNVAFETFLGSASKARQVLSELREFSSLTPFEPEQVIQAGKALLAFGFTAEELTPTLKSIGDIAAGTGKDFNELALIFGKARTSGVIMADELNQLTEAGIPIIGQFAKQFGVAEREIKDMASAGEISFSDLERAFQELTSEGGKFFDLTAKQSLTVAGRISTLVGNFNALLQAIGERLLPVIGEFVDSFGGFVTLAKELVAVSPAEELEKERVELNLLVTELTDANTSEARRNELITDIEKQYPNFLKNIEKEGDNTKILKDRLNEANKAFAAKIALQIEEDRLAKLKIGSGVQLADQLQEERRVEEQILKIAKEANIQNKIDATTQEGRSAQLKNLIGGNAEFASSLRVLIGLETFRDRQTDSANAAVQDSITAEQQLAETKKRLEPLLEIGNKLLGGQEVATDKVTDATKKLNKEEEDLAKERAKRAAKLQSQLQDDQIANEDAINKQLQDDIDAEKKRVDSIIREQQRLAEEREKNQQDIINAGDAAQLEAEKEDEEEIARQDGITKKQQEEHDKRMAAFQQQDKDAAAARRDAADKQIELAQFVANSILDIAAQQTQAQIEQLDILLDAQRERVSNAVIVAERGNAELLQAEEDRLTELTAARQRAAERQQRIAQIQVAANQLVAVSQGIVAVTRAFAEGTFVQGIATSIALAAQVAAIVASINSAANTPGFAEGTDFVEGPGTGTSDSITARLSRGERVVPARQNQKYFAALNEFQRGTPKADMMMEMMSGNYGGKPTDTSKIEMHLQHLNDRMDNIEMNVSLDANGFNASMQKLQYRQNRKSKLT